MSTVAQLPGTMGVDWWYAYQPGQRVMGGDGGWRATVSFLCKNSILEAFLLTIAGTPVIQQTSYGSLRRIVPLQHPLYRLLWAQSVEAETFGTPSPTDRGLQALHSHARVNVEFGSVLYPTFAGGTGEQDDRAYMQWDIDQSSQATSIPGKKFKFVATSEPTDQDEIVYAALNHYTLALFQCPPLDDGRLAVIDDLAGTINDDVFFGKPAEQLMFNGCKSTQTVTVGGVTSTTMVLSFTYRSYSWNQVYDRTGTLGYVEDTTGQEIYDIKDFNLLLT